MGKNGGDLLLIKLALLTLTFIIAMCMIPFYPDMFRSIRNRIRDLIDAINYNREIPKIEFKLFKTWYELNPEKWILEDDHVYRIGPGVKVKFSRFDTTLYKSWKKSLSKIDHNSIKQERLQKVLEEVRKDIENFKIEEDK